MGILRTLANSHRESSLATRCRRKRLNSLLSLIETTKKPLSLLDIGGTEMFWKTMKWCHADHGVHITLINRTEQTITTEGISADIGDARSLKQYKDGSFDIVFSNSVIEHLESFPNQQRMADEVRRVGLRYFVQTPNKGFPLEPHFLFPFFQFLPSALDT